MTDPPDPSEKKVVVLFEKSDVAPVVRLDEYDLVEVNPIKGSLICVHVRKEKDERWTDATRCMVIDNKVKFLVTTITAKQAQIERHQKEIAKLVAQLKRYAVSEDPAFKQSV
jgi:hypothetical protein